MPGNVRRLRDEDINPCIEVGELVNPNSHFILPGLLTDVTDINFSFKGNRCLQEVPRSK